VEAGLEAQVDVTVTGRPAASDLAVGVGARPGSRAVAHPAWHLRSVRVRVSTYVAPGPAPVAPLPAHWSACLCAVQRAHLVDGAVARAASGDVAFCINRNHRQGVV
jgi:hypothetical protein